MAEIRINETGTLKLFDADDSHSAGIAAGTISADATLMTLNTADIDISVPIDVTGASTITTADNTDTLTLKSTDTDDDIGPNLRLFRAVTGADNDSIGTIDLAGQDDGGNNTDYASISGQIVDASNGSEDGKLTLKVMNAGSLNQMLTITGPETVVNEGSKDHDFRVESDGNTHMLFVDAGNDCVNIGASSDRGGLLNVEGNGGVVIRVADNNDALKLQSTDTDANAGPLLTLERSNNSAANADETGKIVFKAQNNANEATVYSRIVSQINDVTDGAEDGIISLQTIINGTLREGMRISDGGVVVNELSQDMDFRIESNDNTHMLFVDAGSNHVSINEFDGGGEFNVKSVSQTGVVVESNSASIGQFVGKNNSASNDTQIMVLQSARNSTAHFEFGRFKSNDGSDLEMLFDGAGAIKIDGVVTTGGIDYAEYFEWKDGNSSSEDRRGHSVITDGNKIVVATSSDDASKIIGIVSTNPTVLGDADLERWMFKYERDDYGSLVWEEHTVTEWTETINNEDGTTTTKDHSYDTDRIPSDLTVPSDATVISEEEDRYGNTIKLKRKKLNSNWDSSQQYISREDRKEWEAIGLVGKLRLKKGEPVNPNWIKMRDISDTVEEWLVR